MGKERVVIVGAGTMGCGIAAVWAKAGHQVTLYDPIDAARRAARKRITGILDQLVEAKALLASQVEEAMRLVDTSADIHAASEATFVLEAGPEDLETKRVNFGTLDRLTPTDALLASNSSSLTLSETGANVVHRERFLATHFYNPAYLIPLVEIATTPETADWAFQRAYALMMEIGKVPVRCADSSGYIGSRLQLPLVMEAIKMVQQGIATAEDIDKAIRNSWGPRVAVMGPLEMADRGGLDIWLQAGDNFARVFDDPKFAGPDLLREMVGRGELGIKTGKGLHGNASALTAAGRDRQLIGLLQHLRLMPCLNE